MVKDEEGERDPFEIYVAGDDIDDDPFLTNKEELPRPLVGPESLTMPLGSDD